MAVRLPQGSSKHCTDTIFVATRVFHKFWTVEITSSPPHNLLWKPASRIMNVTNLPKLYVRNGTVDNFMFLQPHGNWRRVSVRKRKTQLEFAEEIAHLLDIDFPDAEVVVLVLDNFETHKIGSLYKRFPPDRARAYARRLEIHYTPKHPCEEFYSFSPIDKRPVSD